jgi:cytochrome c-type biogenesis protein CcsB
VNLEQLNDWSNAAFNAALFAYVAAMAASFAYVAFRAPALSWASTAAGVGGLALNLGAIVTRGLAAERFPWGNMYEYSMAMALLVVVAYLVGVELVHRIRTLGGPVYAFVVFTLAMASLFFYVPAGPLLPALNSYWRQIHVTSMITASSLLGIGCVLTVLYLLKDVVERRRVERLRSETTPPIMGAAVDAEVTPDHLPGDDGPVLVAPEAARRAWFPSAATLDRLAYRFISFGFPIWTFGVIGGAIWAQQAWGRYWGWDPKETWSFITWVIFAGYLHARATSGWRGRRAAAIALVGFVSLLVTYYAVNLWIAGLHSYAT